MVTATSPAVHAAPSQIVHRSLCSRNAGRLLRAAALSAIRCPSPILLAAPFPRSRRPMSDAGGGK